MKKLILFTATLCIGTFICGEEDPVILNSQFSILNSKVFVPKDPMLAGLLSVQLPGLGQIYCRRYLRGLTYIASEIGCFALAGTIAGIETQIYSWDAVNEKTGMKRKLTQEVTVSRWDELSGLEKSGVVGLILGGLGLHIWGVIDAYNIAQEHNQRLGWMNPEKGGIDVKLGFSTKGSSRFRSGKENDPLLELAVFKKF